MPPDNSLKNRHLHLHRACQATHACRNRNAGNRRAVAEIHRDGRERPVRIDPIPCCFNELRLARDLQLSGREPLRDGGGTTGTEEEL